MNNPQNDRSFFGHPAGLNILFFTEFWERFSYYGMRALLMLFMVAPITAGGLGMETPRAANIYGWYTSLVYALAIPGGWIADQFIGQRYAVLVGGILITLGHFSMAFHSIEFFYAGLALIVIGTGFLKPNISAIVGQLYAPDDERRDAGFTIFYMGINLGAWFAPFITGYLGQKIDWHYGFAAAGVGMTFGLVWYVVGWKKLGTAGLRPAKKDKSSLAEPLPPLTRQDWGRIGAIGALFIFSMLFWGAFEQAGSSLSLFADKLTNMTFLGWKVPSSYFQSVNPFFIVLLGAVAAWLWVRLGRRNPSSPAKFAFGLIFVGLGFLVMAMAANVSGPEAKLVSPMWLTMCYLLHTIGELCLSPVGLSTVTKLAPPRLVGFMMGVWFLSISFGNKLGGWVAGYFDSFPLPKLFGAVFLTTAVAGLILFALIKPIRRLMGGVH